MRDALKSPNVSSLAKFGIRLGAVRRGRVITRSDLPTVFLFFTGKYGSVTCTGTHRRARTRASVDVIGIVKVGTVIDRADDEKQVVVFGTPTTADPGEGIVRATIPQQMEADASLPLAFDEAHRSCATRLYDTTTLGVNTRRLYE